MSKGKRFRIWLVISISALGMLSILPLIQYHGRNQPIANTEPLSTVQTSPEAQRRSVKPQSTTSPTVIKIAQQGTQTEQSQSKDLENAPTAPNASETTPALDKTDTIHSLLHSLSAEDIEVLEGLTLKDFLSDEELEKLDRKIAESLKEFAMLVPKIVEHKAKLDEITAYNNSLAEQENWWEDRAQSEEIAKNNELIKEMFNELATLRSRASDLESILLDSDFDSIGTQRDKEWIRQLVADIWN